MGDRLLPREDDDVAEVVYESYKSLGVDILFNSEINHVEQSDEKVLISYTEW